MAKKLPPDDEMEDEAAEDRGAGMSGGMMPDDGAEEAPADEAGEAEEDVGGQVEMAEGGGMQRKPTPEQVEQYRRFVGLGYHLIYKGGRPNPKILEGLKTEDPREGLARTAVDIVMRLVTDAAKKNVPLDGAVVYTGGIELFSDLAALAGKVGIHKFTQPEIDSAFILAMDMAQKEMQAAGMLDIKDLARSVQEMNKADEEGRLDEVLPGLGKISDEVKAGVQKGASGQGGKRGAAQVAAEEEEGAEDEAAAEAEGAPAEEDDEDQPFKGFN